MFSEELLKEGIAEGGNREEGVGRKVDSGEVDVGNGEDNKDDDDNKLRTKCDED